MYSRKQFIINNAFCACGLLTAKGEDHLISFPDNHTQNRVLFRKVTSNLQIINTADDYLLLKSIEYPTELCVISKKLFNLIDTLIVKKDEILIKLINSSPEGYFISHSNKKTKISKKQDNFCITKNDNIELRFNINGIMGYFLKFIAIGYIIRDAYKFKDEVLLTVDTMFKIFRYNIPENKIIGEFYTDNEPVNIFPGRQNLYITHPSANNFSYHNKGNDIPEELPNVKCLKGLIRILETETVVIFFNKGYNYIELRDKMFRTINAIYPDNQILDIFLITSNKFIIVYSNGIIQICQLASSNFIVIKQLGLSKPFEYSSNVKNKITFATQNCEQIYEAEINHSNDGLYFHQAISNDIPCVLSKFNNSYYIYNGETILVRTDAAR